MTPKQACFGDPFGRIFADRPVWSTLAAVCLLYGIMLTVWSFLSSNGFGRAHPNLDYLPVTEEKDEFFTLISYWVYSPLVWLCYAWQPRYIAALFKRIHNEGFIGRPKGTHSNQLLLAELVSAPRKIQQAVGLAIVTVIGIGSWAYINILALPCPLEPYCFGKPRSWLYEDHFFFEFVWTPLIVITVVMLAIIFVRQVLTTLLISRLFAYYRLAPKLFHTDNYCGLLFVNGFAVKSSVPAIGTAIWLAFLTFYPTFPQALPSPTPLLWLYYVLVALALPFFFWRPIVVLNTSLKEAEHALLEPIGAILRSRVPKSNTEFQSAVRADLHETIVLYESLHSAYPHSPLPIYRRVTFLLVGLAPPVLALVTFIFQILQPQKH